MVCIDSKREWLQNERSVIHKQDQLNVYLPMSMISDVYEKTAGSNLYEIHSDIYHARSHISAGLKGCRKNLSIVVGARIALLLADNEPVDPNVEDWEARSQEHCPSEL